MIPAPIPEGNLKISRLNTLAEKSAKITLTNHMKSNFKSKAK
jgi:hypothetical protein